MRSFLLDILSATLRSGFLLLLTQRTVTTMNNNQHVNIDFNLFSLAFVCSFVLAVVKLIGLANISWLVVFIPVIAILTIDLVFVVVFLVIALVIYLVHRSNKKGM